MPVVVVATLIAKPDSVDTVRAACKRAIEAVHQEPGCELYALHENNGTFVFVEQWADPEALKRALAPIPQARLFSPVRDRPTRNGLPSNLAAGA